RWARRASASHALGGQRPGGALQPEDRLGERHTCQCPAYPGLRCRRTLRVREVRALQHAGRTLPRAQLSDAQPGQWNPSYGVVTVQEEHPASTVPKAGSAAPELVAVRPLFACAMCSMASRSVATWLGMWYCVTSSLIGRSPCRSKTSMPMAMSNSSRSTWIDSLNSTVRATERSPKPR